jgi:predicted TIM-barrel fold metal-dependent hydrolase
MPVIDADAHVIECEQTWDYIPEAERRFSPQLVVSPRNGTRFWQIGDRVFPISNVNYSTPEGSRELTDVNARLVHMDELGIDVQVIYPTLFLRVVTARPDVEQALCRGYNRWLGQIWSLAKGRIRYVAILPYLTMDSALEEARLAKERGACGLMIHASEGDKLLSDPYFYPIYEEASKLNLPVCVHAGTGSLPLYDYYAQDPFLRFQLSTVGAFHHLMHQGIPQLFPDLRWGIVELTAQWLPYILNILVKEWRSEEALRQQQPNHPIVTNFGPRAEPRTLVYQEMLRESRVYVACQTTDDFPLVLGYAGEDHLMVGTDYGHADFSNDLEAMQKLAKSGEISHRVMEKITRENPKRLYAL